MVRHCEEAGRARSAAAFSQWLSQMDVGRPAHAAQHVASTAELLAASDCIRTALVARSSNKFTSTQSLSMELLQAALWRTVSALLVQCSARGLLCTPTGALTHVILR